jgi:hypothetical protein
MNGQSGLNRLRVIKITGKKRKERNKRMSDSKNQVADFGSQ